MPHPHIIDTSNYELKYTLSDPTPKNDELVTELSWSPYGDILLKITQWDIDLWNLTASSGKYIKNIERLTQLPSVSWHPNNQYFADVEGVDINNQRKVTIYDTSSNKIVNTFKSPSAAIQDILWSQDGNQLIASTWQDEIQLWNAKTFELVNSVSLPTGGPSYVWASQDEIIGTYCSSTIDLCTLWLLNIKSFKWEEPFEKKIPIQDFLGYGTLQVSPDHSLLASDGGQGIIFVFDISTGKVHHEFNAHSGSLVSISWNPDSTKLVTGGTDGAIYIWDMP